VVALPGNLWTDTGASSWYEEIEKPARTPPGWVFVPVWTFLYLAMGIAACLVWCASESARDAALPLGVWGLQVTLNLASSFAFFAQESPVVGVDDIVLLWLAIVLFARKSTAAAALLVPYLLWVTFAGALNIEIARLNWSDLRRVLAIPATGWAGSGARGRWASPAPP
jgi:translocator protein